MGSVYLKYLRCVICVCASVYSIGALGKSVTLRWETVKKAVSYEVEVLKDGKSLLTEAVESEEPKWKKEFPPGLYRYHVRAIDNDGKPGEWTKLQSFIIPADAPELIFPKGKVLHDVKEPVHFEWKEVPGALEYEVEVTETTESGTPKVTRKRVKETFVDVPVETQGNYSFNVRALASVESDDAKVMAPNASTQGFRLVENPEKVGSYRITSAYQFWPYEYKMVSSATQSYTSTKALSSGFRVTGEYGTRQWVLRGYFEDTGTSIEGRREGLVAIGLGLRKRFALSDRFTLLTGLGGSTLEHQEMKREGYTLNTTAAGFATVRGDLDLELQYELSTKLRLSLLGVYSVPMAIWLNVNARTLASGYNFENYRGGLKANYALSPAFQISLFGGYRYEKLTYRLPSYAGLEQQSMQGALLALGIGYYWEN